VAYAYALPGREADESRIVRRIGFLLAFLAIPAFAGVALILGKEAGWDLRNYHWYDPYALLTGRIGFDLAVAHHATYYNPLIDVPFYWIGSHFPAWVAGVWLGGICGLAAAIVGGIAYRIVALEDKRLRLAAAALLAILGMMGGGALGEIGKTTDDIAGALGALAGLLVLVSAPDRVARAAWNDIGAILVPAGILAGASAGLKLTTAPYVVALAAALLVLRGTFSDRIRRTAAFSVGVVVGIALFGGYWYWRMYRFSGDPLFPYFNNIFPTDLVKPGDYSDPTFKPRSWIEYLIYPFIFSANSFRVAEWHFRDIHIAIAYVLIPLAGMTALLRLGDRQRRVEPLAATLLLVAAAVTYVLWLVLFDVYRYLVPLEMLCPTIIVAALAWLPVSRRAWIGASAVLLLAAQALATRGDDPRLGWAGNYVDVEVPPLSDPAHSMVLMVQTQPTAYLIPAFPPEIPFLRIQGWLVGSQDRTWGMGAEMHRRVEEHKGPIYALFWPSERIGVDPSLADYDLVIDDSGCAPVRSNLDGIGYFKSAPVLCPLTRKAQ